MLASNGSVFDDAAASSGPVASATVPQPHLIADDSGLPDLHAEALCKKRSSTWADPSKVYRDCIAYQQAAYYHAEDLWASATAADRFRCTNAATLQGGSFIVLDGCLATLDGSGD